MTTYISLLRGINVSGQKLIKMDMLRMSYERLGFKNVSTYLQSGNVVFNASERDLCEIERELSLQIEKDFGFNVQTIVLTIENLKQIIDNNPFLNDVNKDQSFFYITFFSSKPDFSNSKAIEDKKQSLEEIIMSDDVAYLYCPNGYGRTKLTNNFLETKLKIRATTRNWKTTNELLKIAQELN